MAPLAYHSLKDGVVGREFKQLFQHYPVLEPFYFEFEKNFHAEKYVNFAKANWQVPLAFIGVYILMIAVVPRLMAKREKGLNLKLPFAYWNLCLSLFSFCGMIRTAPHLVYNITHAKSFRDTICTPAEVSYGEGACGLWVMLFIFSKIPELGDTAFIVFKKSKLDFLQWYHHITVLLFCWHSYANTSSTGLYFVAMNYSVHAIMYGYFFLKQIDAWPKWVPPQFITVAQIAQMVVGTTVSYFSYVYLKDGYECDVKAENVVAGGLMYGSYLYLFCKFFVDKFIFNVKAKGKGGKSLGASGAGKSTKMA